jgi:DNA-binding NtrC family response regulator
MKPAKVLLVDDEVDLAEAIVQRLKIRRYAARAAFSGAGAIAALQEEDPDVMIIDLYLQGMLGIDLARSVRRIRPEIVTIMLSGHGSSDAERWISNGEIFDFVMKPVEIQQLVQKIDRAKKEHDERQKRGVCGHARH